MFQDFKAGIWLALQAFIKRLQSSSRVSLSIQDMFVIPQASQFPLV